MPAEGRLWPSDDNNDVRMMCRLGCPGAWVSVSWCQPARHKAWHRTREIHQEKPNMHISRKYTAKIQKQKKIPIMHIDWEGTSWLGGTSQLKRDQLTLPNWTLFCWEYDQKRKFVCTPLFWGTVVCFIAALTALLMCQESISILEVMDQSSNKSSSWLYIPLGSSSQ